MKKSRQRTGKFRERIDCTV